MKKKRTCTTLSILLLTLALLLSSCQGAAEPMKTAETKGDATSSWQPTPPYIKQEDYTPSSAKLEKIDQDWNEDMIQDFTIVSVVFQPCYSNKKYTLDDFKDLLIVGISNEQYLATDGEHCLEVWLEFENPSNSKKQVISILEALESKEEVLKVDSPCVLRLEFNS